MQARQQWREEKSVNIPWKFHIPRKCPSKVREKKTFSNRNKIFTDSISGIKVKARFPRFWGSIFLLALPHFILLLELPYMEYLFKKLYCLRINHILPFFPFHFISLLCSAKQEISGEVGKENARQSVLHTAGVLLRSHLQDKGIRYPSFRSVAADISQPSFSPENALGQNKLLHPGLDPFSTAPLIK